jgi:hypothetical protein
MLLKCQYILICHPVTTINDVSAKSTVTEKMWGTVNVGRVCRQHVTTTRCYWTKLPKVQCQPRGQMTKWAEGGLLTLYLAQETKNIVNKTRNACAFILPQSISSWSGCKASLQCTTADHIPRTWWLYHVYHLALYVRSVIHTVLTDNLPVTSGQMTSQLHMLVNKPF